MNRKTLIKICAVICAASGGIILLWVLVPIISYELFAPPLASYLSPVPPERAPAVDYTKASNWFTDGKNVTDFKSSGVSFYTISIPRLGISNATVSIGGEDLANNLIQYPGTALPGKTGNAVIFGHSVLPSFYNPTDYMTIFSTLPSLKNGDNIAINYDGISYKYVVEEKFEVSPTDIQVLEQNTSDSFITLVTCVPPGDPFRPRRLIVRARVVPLGLSYGNTGN